MIPVTTLTLTSLVKTDGEENMGGMAVKAYVALRSHIKTFPSLIDNPDSVEKLVKLTGNYELETGKYFIEVVPIVKTHQFSYENQGEPEGQSFAPKATFKIKGATKAETMGYARLFNATTGVYIGVDNEGNRIVIGDELHPAILKVSGDTGTDATNRSEITVEVTSDSFCPGYLYYGEIPLSAQETVPSIES